MDIESLIESSWEASGYVIKYPTNRPNLEHFNSHNWAIERTEVLYGTSRADIIKQAEFLIKKDRITTRSFKPEGGRLQVTRVEILDLSTINRGLFTCTMEEEDLYVGNLSEGQREFLKSLLI